MLNLVKMKAKREACEACACAPQGKKHRQQNPNFVFFLLHVSKIMSLLHLPEFIHTHTPACLFVSVCIYLSQQVERGAYFSLHSVGMLDGSTLSQAAI